MNIKMMCRFFSVCAVHIIKEKQGETNYTKQICFSERCGECEFFEGGPQKEKIFDEFKKSPAA